jgi:preprotein translocase subunit SecB
MAEKTDNTPFSVGNIWFPALSYNTFVPPKEKENEYEMGLNLDAVVEGVEYITALADDKHVFRFAVKFTVKNVGKLDKENKLVFEAVGLARGDILLNEKIDTEVVKKFIHANQNIITFPYIRTYIDGILAKVGLPPLGLLIIY